MKRVLKTAVFALCLAAIPYAAVVPTQNLTPYSLALEYHGSLNGHAALYDFDSTAVGSHVLRLHYAPTPYLRFSAGAGGSHMYAEPTAKGARTGFTATGGLGLYTPRLFNVLTITAGYDGFYLKTSEKQNIYHHSQLPGWADSISTPVDTFYVGIAREGYMSGALHTPYAGARFHIGRYVDLEIGGQFYYFNLIGKNRTERHNELMENNGVVSSYENVVYIDVPSEELLMDQVRVYSALTLHERASGAYISGGFSAAVTNMTENMSHLTNFSFWAQIGLIMREPRSHNPRPCREYQRMKARQESMASALYRDPANCRGQNKDKNTGQTEDRHNECPLAENED